MRWAVTFNVGKVRLAEKKFFGPPFGYHNPTLNPTPAHEDSCSAMKWATQSASWAKIRHIAVQAHKIRV